MHYGKIVLDGAVSSPLLPLRSQCASLYSPWFGPKVASGTSLIPRTRNTRFDHLNIPIHFCENQTERRESNKWHRETDEGKNARLPLACTVHAWWHVWVFDDCDWHFFRRTFFSVFNVYLEETGLLFGYRTFFNGNYQLPIAFLLLKFFPSQFQATAAIRRAAGKIDGLENGWNLLFHFFIASPIEKRIAFYVRN